MFHIATVLASVILAGAQLVDTLTLISTGQTVNLDGIPYYVTLEAVTNINSSGSRSHMLQAAAEAGGLLPITVVTANTTSYDENDFAVTINDYVARDDVFSAGFLGAIYIQYVTVPHTSGYPSLTLSGLNVTGPITTIYTPRDAAIPDGPYFVSATGAVYQAWRLYSDVQGAFFETAIGNGDGTYSVLPANIAGQSLAVAVPSRLYYKPTAEKPLAGVRVGIKDIFDIAGLRTSNGNRAWYHFYPPANKTALAVQRLIDAGAIIVGKMATSQFANGETGTADWVSYLEPFNPRGDGYQDTSTSSAGPGAGTGAYDWLDLTVGSDTGGSIRGPCASQGLYGNRPTIGSVPLDNAMPMSPEYDTAGFLTRHPSLWITAAKVMYEENVTISRSYPSVVRTVEFPTSVVKEGDALLIDFLGNLTTFLNGSSSDWNITDDWAATKSANVTNDYESLLNLTYAMLIAKHEVKNLRDPFFAEYAAVHDGRRPFVDPVPTTRWNWSDQYPDTAIAEAAANNTIFGGWFSSTVLVPDNATCSNSIMLYVGSKASTSYRNIYREAPSIPTGYSTGYISPFWGGPDFIVPLGVASYFSNVTNHIEYLPVTVDIMAARGCDGMLYGLIEDLVAAGILPGLVKAGYSGTTGGEVLFKRDMMRF